MFNLLKNKEPAEAPVFAIIAGPGGESFNHVHVEKTVKILNQAGIETVLIGNGEKPISEDAITTTLENFKDNRELTVCFIAHGYKTQKGNHILWLGEKADTETFDLLRKIEKVRKNKSTDFVFTSSYGDTIVPKMYKKLHRSSYITVLSPTDKLVTGDQLVKLMQKVYTNAVLNTYGTHPSKAICLCPNNDTDITPKIALAKKGFIEIRKLSVSHDKHSLAKFFRKAAV